VLVYQENEATEQFELFQIIDDPEVVQSEVTVPYEEQHVHFGSDFAWEVNQCTRFVVGAMAKMDGADGLPTPFGRAYVFTLTETNQSLGAVSIVFIVVGVLVGLAAVTGFVIWLRKRWRKRYDDANAKLLSVMENVTKV
jgi:hypothetical protein